MSKTLHEVAPVEYTYTVKNLYRGHPIEFDSLGRVHDYIMRQVKDSWEQRWTAETKNVTIYDLVSDANICYRHDWKRHSFGMFGTASFTEGSYPFLVTNQFGAIISAKEVAAAPRIGQVYSYLSGWYSRSNSRWDRIDRQDRARLTNKKNVNKIKQFHKTHTEVRNTRGGPEEEVTDVYFWWKRSPKTYNEIRQTDGHNFDDEDGFRFGRAKRSVRHLPQWWDDVDVAAKLSRASWKTNSKRRKQWKPKGE